MPRRSERNPNLRQVQATLSYWMNNRGLSQAEALDAYHERWPGMSDDLFFQAVLEAGRAAREAEIYGFVPKEEQIGDYLTQEEFPGGCAMIRFNVAVPTLSGTWTYRTINVKASLSETREQIEQRAIDDAYASYTATGSPNNTEYENRPEDEVIQVGGIWEC